MTSEPIMDDELKEIVSAVVGALGYDSIKPEQEVALLSFLRGHDIFVSLPTGYGKSLCYAALPAAFDRLLTRTPPSTSIVIAVSPLIALMKDQVASLSARGLAVGCITQESTEEERSKVKNGQYQLVLFSPEALLSFRRWRELLQGESYSSRIVAFIVDEAHCVKKWGVEFRKEYSRLGEVRSILPQSVHVMALTATATKMLRKDVCDVLDMKDPVLVSVSPDKHNIKYVVAGHVTMDKTFGPIADQLYEYHIDVGRTIIFCQKLDDCCKLYRYFRQKLGDHFTFPYGSPDLCRNRVVDMFHSCTEPCIKDSIIKNFSTSTSPLRIVIATIAFGMGVDIHDIRNILHFGACEDVEMYIQAVGRAGRDGNNSTALLLTRKGAKQHISTSMKLYCKNNSKCRREVLFQDFDDQTDKTKQNLRLCMCCDICAAKCVCGSCSEVISGCINFSHLAHV